MSDNKRVNNSVRRRALRAAADAERWSAEPMPKYELFTLFLLGAVSAVGVTAEEPCPEALIVLPDAREVDCGIYHGPHQLRYFLTAPYPAAEVIAAIEEAVRAQGWEPLPYDFLNPESEGVEVRTWSRFVDATGDTRQVVHQWLGDWRNAHGNVLRYGFRYVYPEQGPVHLEDVEVIAFLVPRALLMQGGGEDE